MNISLTLEYRKLCPTIDQRAFLSNSNLNFFGALSKKMTMTPNNGYHS